MTDDTLDLEQLDKEIEGESKVEKRIKDLSGKVKLTAEERDAEKKRADEEVAKNLELQRERDFFAGFADVVSTNPAAKDHKDDILAKVKSGYSVEDATFAVLGKAGKLGQSQPVVDTTNVAGGSAAINQPITGGQKKLSEMTRDEKRTELLKAEQRGDISLS